MTINAFPIQTRRVDFQKILDAEGHAIQVAEDAEQVALDRIATTADKIQTTADRVQTTSDRLSATASAAAALASQNAAANSASVAAGHAASAASVVQQDLSGVTAAALHRSPNAVTVMFVYDTSKDSDGGAWTEKCQHTSWYNEPINGKWLGAQASEAAARAVSGAATGDYFQLTSTGAFRSLNATTGTTEVFRGNKRDFPRLAGIVAEAGNVTIYDLTEPGRPMWMRFVRGAGDTDTVLIGNNRNVNSIFPVNGSIYAGAAGVTDGIFYVFNFISDVAFRNAGNNSSGNARNSIADRNSPVVRFASPGFSFNSGIVNALSATVLPDAPIDPVTGLRVPTIAVATAGGISVIRHDGTVRNSSSTLAFNSIAISPQLLFATRTADATFYWAQNPGALAASFALSTRTNAQAPDFNTGNTAGMISPNRTEYLRRSTTAARVQKARLFESDPARSVTATIANTFNTGHMTGDIRRCYLADTGAGSAGPSVELVTNGTFDTDTSGWLVVLDTTASVVSGRLVITRGNTTGWAYQSISTVIGKEYYLTFQNVSGDPYVLVGNSIGAGDNLFPMGAIITYRVSFVATANQTFISLGFNGTTVGMTATYDNISVREVVADRSYLAAGANITGTLVKTEVAAASQLIAYSGFSAANYATEPYSAQLDFGTGEWSCSAWVRNLHGPRFNLLTKTEDFADGVWWSTSVTAVSNVAEAPNGTLTADKIITGVGQSTAGADGTGAFRQAISVPTNTAWVYSFFAKAAERNNIRVREGVSSGVRINVNLTTGEFSYEVGDTSSMSASVEPSINGWWKITVSRTTGAAESTCRVEIKPGVEVGDGTSGVYIWGADLRVANVTDGVYQPVDTATSPEYRSVIAERAFSSGAFIRLEMVGIGQLRATASDGTTTRTVTTTTAYNTNTWLKARANYRTDGTLELLVNGNPVAATRGNPLLTLNNSNATLTIGNSFALDAPFPGSLALLKFGATVPTPEQAAWIFEQEKHLFQAGAQCCLPDAGAIADLTYDEATDKWIAISATNESEWSGLVRTSVTAVPVGTYARAAAGGGVQLLARGTATLGVDVTIPAYGLREELVKRAEAAARLNAQTATYDFVGGFTANTTTGNTAITTVANLTYPVSFIGARVSGTGIPTNATVQGIVGAIHYLSAAATATGTAVAVNFLDFILPPGLEAKAVSVNGVIQREGPTAAYTRLFDGFREVIRFAVAPGNTAWVQIQTTRSAA
jgi:trimeric autotransporter adhesin